MVCFASSAHRVCALPPGAGDGEQRKSGRKGREVGEMEERLKDRRGVR